MSLSPFGNWNFFSHAATIYFIDCQITFVWIDQVAAFVLAERKKHKVSQKDKMQFD